MLHLHWIAEQRIREAVERGELDGPRPQPGHSLDDPRYAEKLVARLDRAARN